MLPPPLRVGGVSERLEEQLKSFGGTMQEDCGQPTLAEDDVRLLQWMAEGETNRRLSSRLNISQATVTARIGRMMRQFGAVSRTNLIFKAMSAELIRPEGPTPGGDSG